MCEGERGKYFVSLNALLSIQCDAAAWPNTSIDKYVCVCVCVVLLPIPKIQHNIPQIFWGKKTWKHRRRKCHEEDSLCTLWQHLSPVISLNCGWQPYSVCVSVSVCKLLVSCLEQSPTTSDLYLPATNHSGEPSSMWQPSQPFDPASDWPLWAPVPTAILTRVITALWLLVFHPLTHFQRLELGNSNKYEIVLCENAAESFQR